MFTVKEAVKSYNDWFYNTLPKQLKKAAPYVAIGAATSAAAFYGVKKGLDDLTIEVHFVDKDGKTVALQSV